jgi:hypothetical protein
MTHDNAKEISEGRDNSITLIINPREATMFGSFDMEKLIYEQVTICITIYWVKISKLWSKFLSGSI